MTSDLVSIIVPTYNQELWVGKTINSILNQSYKNIEVIVSDDFSTDNTFSIIKSFCNDSRLIFSQNNSNIGIAKNVNKCLEIAKGRYIVMFAGDDIMDSQKIQLQIESLKECPQAVVCIHDVYLIDTLTGNCTTRFSERYNSCLKNGDVCLLFLPKYFMPSISVMFDSEKVGKVRFDEALKYSSEWLFDVDVFIKGKCVYLDKILAYYRINTNNVTKTNDLANSAADETLYALNMAKIKYPSLCNLVDSAHFRISLLIILKDYNFLNSESYSKILRLFRKNGFATSIYYTFKGIFEYFINRKSITNVFRGIFS